MQIMRDKIMLVCEQDLEKAIQTFLNELKIPRPDCWSKNYDLAFKRAAVPAFISALEEIDDIDYCYGFDVTKVFSEASCQD